MPAESLAPTSLAPNISAALSRASANSGVDFNFLLETAKRESSLNPLATAKTSSAAGLFQFIEQTWLGAVKDYGEKHGLAAEARAIERGVDGKLSVRDEKLREHILDLRFSVEKAASLAAELTADQRDHLEAKLGKKVGSGALYAAHFLGLGGATKLLNAPQAAKAADLFPKAAQANRAVFFEGDRAKTIQELLSSFEKTYTNQSTGVDSTDFTPPSKTANITAPSAPLSGPDDRQISPDAKLTPSRSFAALAPIAPGQGTGKSLGLAPAVLGVLLNLENLELDPRILRRDKDKS